KEGCGWRNTKGVGFMTTGDTDGEAKFGEFPWMVAILKIEPVNNNEPGGQQLNVYVGGGSLIHMRVVLTTAHYVAKANKLRVRAGEWDTQTTKEIYPYQDRDVDSIEIHKDFNAGMLLKEGCGWRNTKGVGFMTTGDTDGEAKFGEFPWMVAILKIEPVNNNEPGGQQLNVYVGGGSLIHMRVVLTTAHYVAKANKLRVRAGEWDTQTTKEIYPYQDRDVDSIEIHKDFNAGNLFYDIALLFLNKPMDPAPNIGVACLPPPKRLQTAGTRCFASGWGKDKFGKAGRYQVILKKVELPVVKHSTCQGLLRKTRLGRLFELHRSFMCAGGEAGIDTCKGDGGSPLVCPMEVRQKKERKK
ncbi:phenoloxidase-activating factor 2-like, partial [Ostrinia furnacalis]|uniref:phenoloxidase-activating factor 2-like n=1 Tax=Ostrinia furnacalis TaxID=93504 RepID=UPI00103C2124